MKLAALPNRTRNRILASSVVCKGKDNSKCQGLSVATERPRQAYALDQKHHPPCCITKMLIISDWLAGIHVSSRYSLQIAVIV